MFFGLEISRCCPICQADRTICIYSCYFLDIWKFLLHSSEIFSLELQATVCTHLGLYLKQTKAHVYQPYEHNFNSIDIPEVVQDCGSGGDCFYKWVTKYLHNKNDVSALCITLLIFYFSECIKVNKVITQARKLQC